MTNTTKKAIMTRWIILAAAAVAALLMLVMPVRAESNIPSAKGKYRKEIKTVYIENAQMGVYAGVKPKYTASVRKQDQHLYKITYEGWKKVGEGGFLVREKGRTAAFKEGEKYFYHIRLELTDEAREQGYSLPVHTEAKNIVINGKKAASYGEFNGTSGAIVGEHMYEMNWDYYPQAYRADYGIAVPAAKYADGLQKNANGKWYYYKNGKIDKSYTGFAKSPKNGKYYVVRKGVLDWNFTGVAKNPRNGKWYFARKGQFNTKFTGVAKSIKNGKWYYVRKGGLDWKYTGLAKSVSNGRLYYVRKGQLNWKYNGRVKYQGRTYRVRNGRAR